VASAEKLAARLCGAHVPVLWNEHGMTVVFPQPCEGIVTRYQLACHRGEAHAIIMPNVDEGLISEFVGDYLTWWADEALPVQRISVAA
jgi:hypothetical protein